MSTLHTPPFEFASPDLGDYTPKHDYQFMIGPRVVSLIGPPAVGRRQIIATAADMFPEDITPLEPQEMHDGWSSDDTEQPTNIQRVGLVTDSHQWFRHFTNRYRPGTPEREHQRQEALDCLQWLNKNAKNVLILYNVDRQPRVTAGKLHAFLTEGRGDSAEGAKLLLNLQLAAETMGV